MNEKAPELQAYEDMAKAYGVADEQHNTPESEPVVEHTTMNGERVGLHTSEEAFRLVGAESFKPGQLVSGFGTQMCSARFRAG
jgi:hypothetical protein